MVRAREGLKQNRGRHTRLPVPTDPTATCPARSRFSRGFHPGVGASAGAPRSPAARARHLGGEARVLRARYPGNPEGRKGREEVSPSGVVQPRGREPDISARVPRADPPARLRRPRRIRTKSERSRVPGAASARRSARFPGGGAATL